MEQSPPVAALPSSFVPCEGQPSWSPVPGLCEFGTGRRKGGPYRPYNCVTLPRVMASRSAAGTPWKISSSTSSEHGQVESTWG